MFNQLNVFAKMYIYKLCVAVYNKNRFCVPWRGIMMYSFQGGPEGYAMFEKRGGDRVESAE